MRPYWEEEATEFAEICATHTDGGYVGDNCEGDYDSGEPYDDEASRKALADYLNGIDRTVPPMSRETIELMSAAERGDVHTIQRLLAAGADVNARRRDGRTALIVATRAGQLGAMEALAVANPTMQPTDIDYDDGLHSAAVRNDVKGIEAMLNYGAHLESTGTSGEKALQGAVSYKNMEAAQALLAAGADVNDTSGCWVPPLMIAAERGDLDMVHVLLQKGAEVNAADGDDGRTALMNAVEGGYEDVVEELLKAGADVDQEDEYDRTAMSTAITNEYWGIMKQLDQYRDSPQNSSGTVA